jgi:hypothetical protein
VAPLAEAPLASMLENYLLGLACPTEQQQCANQAAVVQKASLALQGAARVMQEHVSTAAQQVRFSYQTECADYTMHTHSRICVRVAKIERLGVVACVSMLFCFLQA